MFLVAVNRLEQFFAGMFSPEWLAALSGILLLDLLLSGDNAILIALACKNLPHEMRRKAIIVGHHMFNFKDTYALFKNRDACITVKSGKELTDAVVRLFDDPAHRERMERETLAIVDENKGASRKSAILLHEMLDKYESAAENLTHVRSTQKIANLQTYFIDLVHSKEVHGVFLHLLLALGGAGRAGPASGWPPAR